jgi:hypothetical protein
MLPPSSPWRHVGILPQRRHNPEDLDLKYYRRESLIPRITKAGRSPEFEPEASLKRVKHVATELIRSVNLHTPSDLPVTSLDNYYKTPH